MYRVVHAPRVAVRVSPSTTSEMAGTIRVGEELAVQQVRPPSGIVASYTRADDMVCIHCVAGVALDRYALCGRGGSIETGCCGTQVCKGWVQLAGRPAGWVLIDGDVVGLGQLLEEVSVPEETIRLRFCRPDNGELLHEAQIPYSTTVGQVRPQE